MRLVWSRRAIDDRLANLDYLEPLNPEAAVALDDEVLKSARSLVKFPEMGRSGTRELVVPGTSYILVYKKLPDRVRILRVLHGRQKWPK